MAEFVITVPVLPGKRAVLEELMKVCSGPRQAELADLQKRQGVTKESIFLESGPGGDRCIVYQEAKDPMAAMQTLVSSKHPFDVWLKEKLKEVTGIDFSNPPAGEPPREIFRWGY